MATPLNCLIVEDSPDDAELVLRELRRAGFEPVWTRVETEADFLAQLKSPPDIVLSDYSMPQFNGLRALELLHERKLEVPFILISGTVGEETAVEAMKRGATDYLLKDRLARLGQAVRHAREHSHLREEARRAELVMHQSEHKYRHLFENLSEAAFLMDGQSQRIIDANLSAERMLGRTRSEIVGLDATQLFPVKDAQGLVRELGNPAMGGGSQFDDAGINTKQGVTIPVRISMAPVELYGRKLVLALVADITERKRAEESLRESEAKFRQLAENIQEVFWITDPAKQQMLYVSPAYEKIWGRSCDHLYRSPQDWLAAIHPDDQQFILEAVALKQTRGDYDETYRIVRPDGSIRWIRDRAFPIRNAAGEVYRIVGTAEDITAQRDLEEQFRQAQKMESIGHLAGGVAHDFNNILSVIQIHASLMISGGNTAEETVDSAEQISLAAERAAALTRQLLLFSRKQVMQPQDVDLNEVIQNLVKMLQRLLGPDVKLRVQSEAGLPLVRADAGMMEQVLMNLAVNARDAMPSGGQMLIELSAPTVDEEFHQLQPDAPPGRYVCLNATDTGSGIPPDVLPRIFEPFFTTKEIGKGTGLGLATVYGIVRQHGGFIRVYSEPGSGAAFHIYLPALSPKRQTSASGLRPAEVRGGHETILLVEDELRLRAVIRNLLERHGYRVLEADSGVEALRIWRTNAGKVDLLFTDMAMPGGVNGRELADQLRREHPALKIIFTSGYSASVVGADLNLQEGINFIQKPCHPRMLAQTVRNCLDAPAD